MLETSPFLGNPPKKRTLFLLREKQVRVSPPHTLNLGLQFLFDFCFVLHFWGQMLNLYNLEEVDTQTYILTLSLRQHEWMGMFSIQSLAHRCHPGARVGQHLEVLLLRLKCGGFAVLCRGGRSWVGRVVYKEPDSLLCKIPSPSREQQNV